MGRKQTTPEGPFFPEELRGVNYDVPFLLLSEDKPPSSSTARAREGASVLLLGHKNSEAHPDRSRTGFSKPPVTLQSEWKKNFFFHLGAKQICYREVYISMGTGLILALPHLMPTRKVQYWVTAQGRGKVSHWTGSE